MSRGPAVSRRGALKGLGAAAALPGLGAGPAAAPAPDAEPVRVTVGYESAAAERAVRESAREVVYEFGFDALTVRVEAAAVEALRGRGDVRYVERDGVYEVASQTTPWGVDRVDADVAHDRDRGGEGAHVAVVDTGIDGDHGDLAPNVGEGTAFQGGVQHGGWQDDNGHGTHVAGTVGALDDDGGVVGVAPEVTLHPVKVIASPGFGLTSDIAKGIEWTADQGYDVANLSLQGEHLEAVAEACEYAAERGVTLVAAAGNGDGCSDCVTYPAAYPEVVAVSSTNREDDVAAHSSRGPEVDVAAPGTNVYSTYLDGYATLSGTSMACPHVAGAAAQLAAEGRSREEIRETLVDTAEDVGLSSNEAGAGLLDVAAALGVDGGAAASESESESDPEPDPDEPPSTPESEPDPATETPVSSSAESGEEAAATETPTPTESGASGSGGGAQTPTATEASTPTATEEAARTPTDAGSGTGTGTGGGAETPTPAATETPETTAGTPTPSGDGLGLGAAWGAVRDAIRSVFGGLT